MSWHITQEIVAVYRDGHLSDVTTDSIEAHLIECADCRDLVTAAVDTERRDRLWDEIVDRIDQPRPRWMERGLRGLGVPAHLARLVAVAAVIPLSWVAFAGLALTVAAIAARSFGTLAFLVVAPVLAVIGVAMSLTPSASPLDDLEAASPTGRLWLVIIRSVTVMVVIALVALAPGLLLDESRAVGLFLLPAVACTLLTLILSTISGPVTAAFGVSILWIAAVTAIERSATTPLASFQRPAQGAFAVLAVCLVAVLALRRGVFDLPARRGAG